MKGHLAILLLIFVALGACARGARPEPAPGATADLSPTAALATEKKRAIVEPPAAIAWEPHRFEARSGDAVAADIGVLRVPERRGSAQSRAIELRFVRFPSTAVRPGPPIVYLAGGPGGSGIEAARGRRFSLFMALRELGDVIALDQRGTGLSNQVPPCAAPEPWPVERPVTREALGPWLEETARHCAATWRAAGVDIAGYTTVESADDLESLRRGLGVDKLRLLGISYGTHLAMAVARRHPELVDSMVLASAEGLDQTVKLPARTEAFLERILPAESRAQLGAALAQLDRAPAVASARHPQTGAQVEVGIGKLGVQILLGYLIKNPETQAALPSMIEAMARGDYAALAPYMLMVNASLQGMTGMSEAMDAASGISPERRALVAAQAPGTLLGDALNYPGDALAGALGVPDLGDDFRAPLRSDVRTLFLSGDLDGRTYVESHREIAAGFARSSHLVVRGAGHDLFMASPDVAARIALFFAGKLQDLTDIEAGPR